MALGTFVVTIDGNRLGAGTEKTAQVQVRFASGREFVKDTDAGLFWFPHLTNPKPQPVSLPHTVTLVTDVTTGVSAEIGYEIIVTTAANGRVVAGPFPAQAANTTIDLTDVTADFTGIVPEDIAVRAETARDEAESAAASVQREQPNGVAGLDGSGKLLEARIPARLAETSLASKFPKPRGKTAPGDAAPSAYFNVRDYGAVGDGIVDDTAAIQAAVTAASDCTLYFPAGDYKISATVNLPGRITLLGESAKGGSASRFTATHTGYCFAAPAASNFRLDVKNLFLTCVSGFDLRSTTLANIGLCSFDTVAFGGGNGTGVAINCLNHDFSRITNCGFFWNGLCAIRLSGWYGTGGLKAITAMQVSNNYFGTPLKIGVSADIFDSIYMQQNDFGSVQYPFDIGGARFDEFSPSNSTHFKRGEGKPAEGYFGTGTNAYVRDNHIEGFDVAVSAFGKADELKSLHVNDNNVFMHSAGTYFAIIREAVRSTFANNEIDYATYTTAQCFNYGGTINLVLRENNFFTRVFDGTANTNGYIDIGNNFFADIRKGIDGKAYNVSVTPTFSRVKVTDITSDLAAAGALSAPQGWLHRPVSAAATLLQNATVDLFTFTGNLAGTLYIKCAVNGVGTTGSVWAIYSGGATRISAEPNTPNLYSITVDGGTGKVKLVAGVAGSNIYAASGFLTAVS